MTLPSGTRRTVTKGRQFVKRKPWPFFGVLGKFEKNRKVGFFYVFPPTFASPIEKPGLLRPENLSGKGLKHSFIREKRRFSAFRRNTSWAQIFPRDEKADPKTGRQRIKKMVDHFRTFQNFSLHLKMTNFSSPSRWGVPVISKKSPRDS